MNPAHTTVLTLLLATAALAGCTTSPQAGCTGTGEPVFAPETPIDHDANPCARYRDAGFDGTTWPDLRGHTLTILDHGAFDYAFGAAKPLFENLTGATVKNVAADDAGTALQLAIQDHQTGGGSFDILYGIDNVLMTKAANAGIFAPYTPLGADRIDPGLRFVPTVDGAWLATPVDHGVIAVNTDGRVGLNIHDLDALAERANLFVTPDPRLSSPGLGFLVATVAAHGDPGYLDYWGRLFDGGVTITTGWTEAYVDRFSGGYGQWEDGTKGDKPIVTSYTTSPAYEMYYGYDVQNGLITAPQSTFHQIQTMGILAGADRIAAEAWIEFTLTDDFQALAAAYNAIYPVVHSPAVALSVDAVYQGIAPPPESLHGTGFSAEELGRNVDAWVAAWTDLYESRQA